MDRLGDHAPLSTGNVFDYLQSDMLHLRHSVDATVNTASSSSRESLTAHPSGVGSFSAPSSSSLMARMLGKRMRCSENALSINDDEVVVVPTQLDHNISPKTLRPVVSGPPDTEFKVVHEFIVPLSPGENSGVKRSRGRGRGRGGRQPGGQGRGRARGRGSNAVELSPSTALPAGWCPVPLADIIYQKAVGSDNLFKPGDWCAEVLDTGERRRGFAAIQSVLRCAGLESVFATVTESSWPAEAENWRELPLHTPCQGLISDLETAIGPDSAQAIISDCSFRVDLDADAESTGEGGAQRLRVRMRLCARAAVRQLLRGLPLMDFIGANTIRVAEWRAATLVTSRRRKRAAKDAGCFRLLDNASDPAAPQPPHFKLPLRCEQLRSLQWMHRREEGAEPFDLVAAKMCHDPSADASCEETPEDSKSKLPSSAELVGWQFELRLREVHHVCGGILGDAMGYGKTATTIGLIDSRRDCKDPPLPGDAKPYFFNSTATLILVPANLLDQWVAEIDKFLGSEAGGLREARDGRLRVIAIKTAVQLKGLTVRQLSSSADVILCSYRLLFSPIYRRRLLELAGNFDVMSQSDGAVARASADVRSLRSNTKRFRTSPLEVGWKHHVETLGDAHRGASQGEAVTDPMALRFPVLEQFWWRRIVFDEFHELEAMGNTAQFDSLRNLCGHYRWGLTGTPPARDLAQIATLARLFHIENLPVAIGDPSGQETTFAREATQSFLDHFVRQNTSREILPVVLREHIVEVHQAAAERALYLQALHDATGDGSAASADYSLRESLLKLCSHFAYGAEAAADASTECRRILSSKQKHLDSMTARATTAANLAEFICRQLPTPISQSLDGCASRNHRDCLLLAMRQCFRGGSSEDVPDALPAAADPPDLTSCTDEPCDGGASSGTGAVVPSPVGVHAVLAGMFTAAQRLGLVELRRLVGRPGGQMGDVLRQVDAASSNLMSPDLVSEATGRMKDHLLAAAQKLDAAMRSFSFFKNTLAASSGEASAEQRSCSLCLDEDIPSDELSITLCAHVFHTDCLREVVAKFGNCPVCRQQLDFARDVAPLCAEIAAAERSGVASKATKGPRGRHLRTETAGKRGDNAELATRFGSKLVAIAERLQAIAQNGEKAIVFCQWEDLKQKIAEALNAFGIAHFQLGGSVYQRGDIIRRFQEEGGEGVARVLLLSLEHSASGTNLTAASHVVFVHPMNAMSAERAVAYEAQAIGRIRRWGQERPEVHCWRFVTRGTVEEAITAEHQRDLWQHHLKHAATKAANCGA